MKKAIYIIGVICCFLAFTGCTHNNGDIGPWFGQWKVERIDKDGEADPDSEGNCMLRFQSSVVTAVLVTYDSGTNTTSTVLKYGNWEENGGYLHLVFKEHSDQPLEALHLDKECSLKVIRRDGKDKQLQLTKDDGTVYTYHLVKW